MNNIKKHKIRRIGIDARFYGPIGKGLGRYTQEIVDNVIKIDNDNEYVIFLRKENFNNFKYSSNNVKKVIADVRWYSFKEQVLMPFYIWKENLDLIHFPHFNVSILCPTKFVITIHDLILTKFPTQRATTLGPILYKIKNIAYKFIIWLGIKRAKKIIAVSNFTKDDIIKHFKVHEQKVVVTYEGVSDLTTRIPHTNTLLSKEREQDKIFSIYNIKKPFLLYVGNAYPHKNLEGLIKVFNKINGKYKNLSLVLVGKDDYFYKRIMNYAESLALWKEGNKNNKVIFPGYVPDENLETLYKNAIAYIFPSFYEGFGLPPLEAMAKGCPVVSSDRTSMPEILGDAAIYFNPEDEKEMRVQIEKIIKDEDLRIGLIKKGKSRVKKYSWQECARKTLEVYKEVLK